MSNFDVDQEVLSDHLAYQRKLIAKLDDMYNELNMLPSRDSFWRWADMYHLDHNIFAKWADSKKWNDVDNEGTEIGWLRRFVRRFITGNLWITASLRNK